MKTTYPPNTPQNKMEWEQHAKKTTDQWFNHISTQNIDYDALERQLFALRKRLANCRQEHYYPLKQKVINLQRLLATRPKQNEGWNNYLAK